MTRRRILQDPGYVLHSYAYKESSLIVEMFTRQSGRVGLLARGARRARSSLRGTLLAFHPLRVSWSGSGELGTLSSVEWIGGQTSLSGIGVMCGFYLNELLLRLLPREDPHEALFAAYSGALTQLASGTGHAAALRSFERRLLVELGYAPPLERDAATGGPVVPERRYEYDPDRGPVAANGGEADARTVLGQTLLDMARDDYTREATRDEARQLLRSLIARRLGGQALHTRTVLSELQDL
ncbi:MAG: DNA repair protein RecO [Betaproteobacteria bacterium RIFCSPLOWO2_02_FULL_66_14]|nr:MAG: DNA repair protein RecO [Betaproteobacteria bacterium RIFCSPLOWO2_02_FULL_66_14]